MNAAPTTSITVTFYNTYEELKLSCDTSAIVSSVTFYHTYEELKRVLTEQRNKFRITFYHTYEELKHVFSFLYIEKIDDAFYHTYKGLEFSQKISGNENGFYFRYETSTQKKEEKPGFFDVQKSYISE